jgi:hypothetical protein
MNNNFMNMMGNMQNMQQRFQQFVQQFRQQNGNADPQQVVQQMLNSGKMSQQQFEQIRQVADMFFGGRKP